VQNPRGMVETRPPTFLPEGGHWCFCLPPNFCTTQKSIFSHQVQFFYFFYHLKLVKTNLGWLGENTSPQYFRQGDTTVMLPPTFAWHKVNLLSSSSVLLFFFLSPEVSDNKPGVDEGNQIIWLHSSNDLEIMLVMLLSTPPSQLLHDTKSIFCHPVKFFHLSTT